MQHGGFYRKLVVWHNLIYRLRQSPYLKRARQYFYKNLKRAEALLTKMSSKLKNIRLVPALNKSQIKLDIDSHKFFMQIWARRMWEGVARPPGPLDPSLS